jgi:hypothetical protein
MKPFYLTLFILFFSSFLFAKENNSIADAPLITTLPDIEQDFVNAVGILLPEEIFNILGEPHKTIDIKMESTNEVIASSWYYEKITKDKNGNYYPITEIDIVDGYIESVVFLNSDLNEIDKVEGQKYQIKKPEKIF